MTRPIVLVDLDDTLFQTEAKCPPGEAPYLTRTAKSSNGRHSFATRRQQGMIGWLLETTDVIPVTARGSTAYAAVEIPFAAGAVIANGAVILDADNRPDPVWREMVRPALAPYADPLAALLEEGSIDAERRGISVRAWIAEEDGMATYAVFKENEGDGSRLTELSFTPGLLDGWVRHHNGNNCALIPPAISKRLAVRHLLDRAHAADPTRPVLGLGDSITDLSYLRLCDWWGMPGRSQLADACAGIFPESAP